MPTGSAIPGELDLVRAFVNTVDLETGEDDLATPAGLATWLGANGLLGQGARARRADLEKAVAVREALRALLVANNGGRADPAAGALLDSAARSARLTVRFGSDGAAVLEPKAAGVAGALGRLLAIVVASMADGTWSRLKACRAESCRWAFYDHARNRSRTWCSMAVCGNRMKARAYRARRAASA